MIKDIKFAMFTTRHASSGHLHSRPMTTQNKALDDDSLWFFMSKQRDPVGDLQADPIVNVVYADPGADTYVSVSGTAALSEDAAKKKQLWSKIGGIRSRRAPGAADLGGEPAVVRRIAGRGSGYRGAIDPWVTAMRHAPATLHLSHAFRSPPAGAIEWEELPSLVQRVRQTPVGPASAPWDATRPAELETAPVSQPFRELKGVAIREVNEPDVFRHFFGR